MSDNRAPLHRLFLIRHGETVDNVAGISAGSRDSALTSHGFQQATRLGEYFAKTKVIFTHVFSSDLSRAYKTAGAIRTHQSSTEPEAPEVVAPEILALKELREQDFGFYEGKPFHDRRLTSDEIAKVPGFQDIESKEALDARVNAFCEGHLNPLLNDTAFDKYLCIAVVSHGMLLSALWRCILRRQLPQTVTLTPELSVTKSLLSLEHLGSWANTGYLELELSILKQVVQPVKNISTLAIDIGKPSTLIQPVNDAPTHETDTSPHPTEPPQSPAHQVEDGERSVSQFSILIKNINCRDHLQGLKRTRGGVGSSKFDESQKGIESFFKRKKPGSDV